MLNLSEVLRGCTDTMILAQLETADSYGYDISKRIRDLSGGRLQLNEGTLYTTFRRLEASNLVESYWGNENSGARRRYYHLTEDGRRMVTENRGDWLGCRKMISCLFGTED